MDYKFILILAICLILYYIYHELEKVKIQVEELSEKVNKNFAMKKNNIPINKNSVPLNKISIQNSSITKPPINKPILKYPVPNQTNLNKPLQRSPNKVTNTIPSSTKITKLESTNQMILIEDDLTTIDSTKKEDNNNLSETETPESYENNSHDLALYSNDNNETSITADDIIDKTEDIVSMDNNKINTIIENDNESSDVESIGFNKISENSDKSTNSDKSINIDTNNDSCDALLLDDSNEASTSSTDVKKKNTKFSDKLNEIPIITDSLNQILNNKKEIVCTDTSEKIETSDNEEIDVNIDIDEIVNESSNNKLKMKTLRRKKLAELQKIASEYGISLNKVKEGKLKNKTKTELCKEIVSKQY